ncbi:uncharacterized protein LOC143145862 [Ptiloglossa arizonensis]|uniref:uncharacterized protein LOC143145862 n=1 Tax=Ptiloglossa arizonensis TaxID=3350558 RepID=UPI003F9F74C2
MVWTSNKNEPSVVNAAPSNPHRHTASCCVLGCAANGRGNRKPDYGVEGGRGDPRTSVIQVAFNYPRSSRTLLRTPKRRRVLDFRYQGNVSRAGTKCPIALEGPEITARRGSSKRLGVRKPWDSPELEDREELSEMTKRSQDGPYRFLPTTPYLPFRQVLQARSQ